MVVVVVVVVVVMVVVVVSEGTNVDKEEEEDGKEADDLALAFCLLVLLSLPLVELCSAFFSLSFSSSRSCLSTLQYSTSFLLSIVCLFSFFLRWYLIAPSVLKGLAFSGQNLHW